MLEGDLKKRLGAPVEILNTGHLGYSPERVLSLPRGICRAFTPQFVVVSIFANDFAGDIKEVLEGRGGDWEEGKYWLGRIRQFCGPRAGLPLRPGPLGQPDSMALRWRVSIPVRYRTSWE